MNLDGMSDSGTIGAFNDLTTVFRDWARPGSPFSPDFSIPKTDKNDPWPDNYPLVDATAVTYGTTYPSGDYAMSYEGTGHISFKLYTGLEYTPTFTTDANGVHHAVVPLYKDAEGGGILELRLTHIDPQDPVRNLHLISPDANPDPTNPFRPMFLEKVAPWNGTLRFMDWTQTNWNPQVTWDDRTHVDRFSFTGAAGVPFEYVAKLASLTHKDIWVNLPYHADENYVRQMARFFRDNVPATQKIYVENSNELWNIGFQQTVDLVYESRRAADPESPDYDPQVQGTDDTGRMAQLAGKKIARIATVWREEFGAARSAAQLRPMLGAHIGLRYWADQAVGYIYRAYGPQVQDVISGIAVAPYVGAQGDMNYYGVDHAGLTMDELFTWMNSFIDTSITTWIGQHKQLTDYFGLSLETYEVGQSLQSQNGLNYALKRDAQEDPRMGLMYQHLVDVWTQMGGQQFNTFSLSNSWGENGYWGILPRIDAPTSVKYAAMLAMVPASSAPTAHVSVAGATTGSRGQTVHSFVDIDDAAGLGGFTVTINYDATRLTLASSDVLAGALLAGWPALTVNTSTPGKVIVSGFSSTPLGAGGGHLLDLAFHVRADAPAGAAAIDLDTTPGALTSLNEGQIVATFTDGAITVPIGTVITGAPPNPPEGSAITLGADLTGAGAGVSYVWHVVAANGQVIADSTDAAFTFTPNNNGAYTVTLTVTDAAGGAGTGQVTINVQNVAPAVSVVGAPAAAVNEGTPLAFSAGVTDAGPADAHAYAWTIKRGNVVVATGTAATIDFTPADDGVYTVTLAVDDGDATTSSTETFTVTNVAPAAAIVGAPATSTEGTQIDLTAGVTDAGSADTFTYAWTVLKNGAAYAAGTGAAFSFTPNDEGTYVVTLIVTDDDGAASATAAATIGVTNVGPVASIGGGPAGSIAEGTLVSLTGSATDAGPGDVLAYAWAVTKDGAAYGAGGAGAAFAFTPTDDGTYVVTLTVSDGDGGSHVVTKQITVTNANPTGAIGGAPATSPEGTGITLSGSVTDAGSADTFTYLWEVTKNGQVVASGTDVGFTFTPADEGTYDVAFTVTDDDGGTNTVTKTITVDNVAPTVAIGGAPADSIVEGTPVHLTSTVTDPGMADARNYAWTVYRGEDLVKSGSGATLDFTPDDDGEYVVTLTATDGDGGTGAATTTITVTNAAPVAGIVGAPATSPEGTTISLTGTKTDAGTGDTHTYLWTVKRGSTTVATGTASTFEFTPPDEGTYVVTFKVTDDDGGTDTATETITVTNVAPTAGIVGAPSTSPEGTTIDLTGTFGDAGADDVLGLSWEVRKGGQLVASGNQAAFSFTPADEGTYVVTFTVTDGDGG
jgi:PKD repeat protein